MSLSAGIILKSRYKILKKIGGGGYARVYLGEDILKEGLWAVKEMNLEDIPANELNSTIEQFWFEAKMLAKLSHPQLPRLEDFFEDGGQYYIIMEYIQGENLFEIIYSTLSPYPLCKVTEWIIEICKVLEYLHSQEPHPVIFRDLKPENVMLTKNNQIKLIDFGISKLFDITRRTREQAKAASLYFSPPEQYGGKVTDERSDIYSLGATMYFLYTSNFPSDSIERIVNNEDVPLPSSFNKQIPMRLNEIILKAMELNKADRYTSIQEVRTDLEDWFFEFNRELDMKNLKNLENRFYMEAVKSLEENNTDNAIYSLGMLLDADETHISGLKLLGDCFLITGKTEKAIRLYREVLDINPDYLEAYIKLNRLNVPVNRADLLSSEKSPCPNCNKENSSTARFCGKCGILLKKGLNIKELLTSPIESVYSEDNYDDSKERDTISIYPGGEFLFIEASKENPIEIKKKDNFLGEWKTEILKKPTIISSYFYSVKVLSEGREIILADNNYDFKFLEQSSIILDRTIYHPNEEIRLVLLTSGHPDENCSLTITGRDNQHIYYEDTFSMDVYGTAFKIIPPHNLGNYIIKALFPGSPSLETTFQVLDYFPSTLEVKLKEYKFVRGFLSGNSLNLNLYITGEGVPFIGELRCELICHYKRCRKVIAGLDSQVLEGNVKFVFKTDRHTGPFELALMTEDGQFLSLPIPFEEKISKEKTCLNRIGDIFEITPVTLLKIKDSIRGVYYRKLPRIEKLFEIEELISEKAQIRVLCDFRQIQIVIINPVDGERGIYNFDSILKGDILEFDNYYPYSFLHLAAWGDKPYETWGVLMSPLNFTAKLYVPREIEPGQEVSIKIESEHTCRCMLIVTNREILNSSPVRQFGWDLYTNIKENTSKLEDHFVDKCSLSSFLSDRLFMNNPSEPLSSNKEEDAEYTDKMTGHLPLPSSPERPEVVHFELLSIDKSVERTLKFPDKAGTWHVFAYLIRGMDYIDLHQEIIARRRIVSIDFDLPSNLCINDRVWAKVYFQTFGESNLIITTLTDRIETIVSGTGILDFEVSSPGEVKGEIFIENKRASLIKSIFQAGLDSIVSSELVLLKKGDFIEGENLVLYPSINHLIIGIIDSIQNFSIDSSEVLSSKLSSLALKYKLISMGNYKGDLQNLNEEINDKLEILNTFITENMFSLWPDGDPSIDVTVKVLTNLIPYLSMNFPPAKDMLHRCAKELLNRGIKKYALTPLSMNFVVTSSELENLIWRFLYGSHTVRPQLLEMLKLLGVNRDGYFYWEGKDFWGGSLEATCQAVRVMYRMSQMDSFHRGLEYIFKNLTKESLVSTSDTLALAVLLSEINLNSSSGAMVNGNMVSFDSSLAVKGKVEVTGDDLIVRKDTLNKINYLEKQKVNYFSIEVFPGEALIGEPLTIMIKKDKTMLCPMARIFLPGNLELLDATPGIQTLYLPVKEDILEVNAFAVRKGEGKVRVILEDFYNPSMCVFGESIKIITSDEEISQ